MIARGKAKDREPVSLRCHVLQNEAIDNDRVAVGEPGQRASDGVDTEGHPVFGALGLAACHRDRYRRYTEGGDLEAATGERKRPGPGSAAKLQQFRPADVSGLAQQVEVIQDLPGRIGRGPVPRPAAETASVDGAETRRLGHLGSAIASWPASSATSLGSRGDEFRHQAC